MHNIVLVLSSLHNREKVVFLVRYDGSLARFPFFFALRSRLKVLYLLMKYLNKFYNQTSVIALSLFKHKLAKSGYILF